MTAEINGIVQVIASLSPAGGGKHLLRLNTSTRKTALVKLGDLVEVQLDAHERPPGVSIPKDLLEELKSEGALDAFQSLAPGKQRHIVDWIDEAARPETRTKRIRIALEVTHRKQEKTARRAIAAP